MLVSVITQDCGSYTTEVGGVMKTKKGILKLIVIALCSLPFLWIVVAAIRGNCYYNASEFPQKLQVERERFEQAFEPVWIDADHTEMDPTRGSGSYSDDDEVTLVSGRDSVIDSIYLDLNRHYGCVYVLHGDWLGGDRHTETPEPRIFIFW